MGRDPNLTYIAAAVSEASRAGAEARLVRGEASGKGAPAFGGRRLAARGLRQETVLTTAVQLRNAISAAGKQLARSFELLGGEARARGIFADAADAAPPGPALVARRARRRMEAFGLFAAAVEGAFLAHHRPGAAAQAVEKLDSVEPRPSLKLFYMERGDTSGLAA